MQMPSLIPESGSLFDRIMTVMLANILWFVCSVPVITFPAATAGLFATLAPLVRGHDPEIFATFFGTMRRQWLRSTLIVVADILIGGVLVFNFTVLDAMEPPTPIFWLFRSLYIFVGSAALLVNLYLWPLLVSTDLHLRPLVTLSAQLAFIHPWRSLLTLGLALLPLSLATFMPPVLSVMGILSLSILIISWGTWPIIEQTDLFRQG